MVGAWQTMANAAPVVRPTGWDFPLLWATLPLVGTLLFAALVIAWVKKWRQGREPVRLTTNAQLAHFRSLYERGEINDEEFTRIRLLLGERLKQEMAIQSPAGSQQVAENNDRRASESSTPSPAGGENGETGPGPGGLSSPPREQSP